MTFSTPTTPSSIVLYALILAAASIPAVFLVLIPSITFILAVITSLRRRQSSSDGKRKPWSSYRTGLYKGRVSHTRHRPAVHSFSYPLFFCVLDLDEVRSLFGSGSNANTNAAALWPMCLLMQFRESDHFKNGEGLLSDGASADNSIRARICRLVAEKTKGKCQPTSEQRVLLVTHLSYYGYCFNPVSFYYILKKQKDGRSSGNDSESSMGDEIDAIVAEVSNTPWNEMQCYVLHPDSVDVDIVKPGRVRPGDNNKPVSKFPRPDEDDIGNDGNNGQHHQKWESINYIFQKAFHVSPFMTMDHNYDWTFWMPRDDRISVSTSMIREGVPYFNAYFDIRRQPFTPFQLCYQLVRMPVYCAIIQVWIHIEAFWLFLKGVEFIPHPKGSETAASEIIAKIMAPFFLVKDWLSKEKSD